MWQFTAAVIVVEMLLSLLLVAGLSAHGPKMKIVYIYITWNLVCICKIKALFCVINSIGSFIHIFFHIYFLFCHASLFFKYLMYVK